MNRPISRIALALVTTLAFGASTGPAAAQTKLKWAHVYEPSEPFHTELVWAAQEIARRTDGRYQIDVFPGLAARQGDRPQPGPDPGLRRHHHLRLELRRAQLPADRGDLLSVYLPRPGPSARLHQERRVQGAGQRLRGQDGHHIVAVTYYGTRHTSSNQPIKSCADMQGLKMRVPDVPAYLAMPRACGANTAPIAFAEVYLALQNGTVEAQENPLYYDRGQEVLRGSEAYRPHRPHR